MFYSCVCLGTLALENDFLSLPRCTWKCHHLFGFRGVLGAIIERCGDALWCEVHTALIIPRSSANKHGMSLDLLCLSLSFCFFLYLLNLLLHLSIPPSFCPFFRWYAGPVEVASPPRKDQRQPLEAEGDRWLGDCQSRSCSQHRLDCFLIWFQSTCF